MKKALILALSAAGAVGACAQGTVTFAEVPGDFQALVYSPDPSNPSVQQIEPGVINPFGPPFAFNGVPIGGNSTSAGPNGFGNGNNFTAELYGIAGTTATAFGQLSALSQYTSTFSTKPAGAGQFLGTFLNADPGIPGATGTIGATLSLAAWYNGNGSFPSLSAAEAAGVPYGWSPLFALNGPLGGQGTPPTAPPNLDGLISFSLIVPAPEPGMMALAVMGTVALLGRRR